MSSKEHQYIQFCKYLHINRIHNEPIESKVRIKGIDYTALNGARQKCNLCNEIWKILELMSISKIIIMNIVRIVLNVEMVFLISVILMRIIIIL